MQVQGVQYESVSQSYLERRQLRKSADVVLLWGLGVGAVISGNFFGWNFGLTAGGFTGLLLATLLMAVMYICLVYCLAELSTAMPHAGGFYSFARTAFGPWAGFLIGVTDTIEYVLTPAVVVVGIGSYLHALFPAIPVYLWWIGAYIISIGINIASTRLTLRVGLIGTLLAMAILMVFYIGVIGSGSFHWELLFNIPPAPGHSEILPNGWYGVFLAIPYAIWFFLAIEEVPLAAEESRNSGRDMPRALLSGMGTLLVLALLTLVLNTGIDGGAMAVGQSQAPLIDGFMAFLPAGTMATISTLAALSGLVVSFYTLIYGHGRVLFALSRAGYYPRWMSVTGRATQTPHYALIVGGMIGLIATWLMDRFGGHMFGAALLNMAVFGAVMSYIGVMASYIKIKRDRPELARPYTSPLGVPGALVGIALAVLALVSTLVVPVYQPGVIGMAVTVGVAVLYFGVYSSKHLVAQAPEEHTALSLEQRILELQTALGKVQYAKSQVEQMLVARSTAVRAVVHDLNHTVQGIQAAIDLWVMDLRNASVYMPLIEDGYERVQCALEQQKRLLHEMRDAALLESGALVLHPQETDMGDLVQGVVQQLTPRYAIADCCLDLTVDEGVPLAWCDPQRMQRVIYNVLDNALRYTTSFRDDGEVKVTVTYEQRMVVCRVCDNGRGIAHADLQRLGKKFTRLAQGEHDPEGMGLGLNFCIGILRLSNGTLSITSPGKGQGTTVTLRLPTVEAAVQRESGSSPVKTREKER